jgi:hypothetical protein
MGVVSKGWIIEPIANVTGNISYLKYATEQGVVQAIFSIGDFFRWNAR